MGTFKHGTRAWKKKARKTGGGGGLDNKVHLHRDDLGLETTPQKGRVVAHPHQYTMWRENGYDGTENSSVLQQGCS